MILFFPINFVHTSKNSRLYLVGVLDQSAVHQFCEHYGRYDLGVAEDDGEAVRIVTIIVIQAGPKVNHLE